MVTVKINGEEKQFPKGTAIETVAKEYQSEFDAPIFIAIENGKIRELAKEVKLPVVIHSRDAAQDTVDIMKAQKAQEIGGVVHCYSYSKELAKTFLDMGFYFGVGGVVTFNNGRKLKEVVEYLPLDRIVIETDCPYLAPVPFRGKRNDSRKLPYVINQIAEIKNLSPEEVEKITMQNAYNLYPKLK